ncbi:hypothetical protein Hanom_Chr10g00911071 [Helianthus anomalus]
MHDEVYKNLKIFVFWSSVTDRMALGLRSVREVTGRCKSGSDTDRIHYVLRSVRDGYGPQDY